MHLQPWPWFEQHVTRVNHVIEQRACSICRDKQWMSCSGGWINLGRVWQVSAILNFEIYKRLFRIEHTVPSVSPWIGGLILANQKWDKGFCSILHLISRVEFKFRQSLDLLFFLPKFFRISKTFGTFFGPGVGSGSTLFLSLIIFKPAETNFGGGQDVRTGTHTEY